MPSHLQGGLLKIVVFVVGMVLLSVISPTVLPVASRADIVSDEQGHLPCPESNKNSSSFIGDWWADTDGDDQRDVNGQVNGSITVQGLTWFGIGALEGQWSTQENRALGSLNLRFLYHTVLFGEDKTAGCFAGSVLFQDGSQESIHGRFKGDATISFLANWHIHTMGSGGANISVPAWSNHPPVLSQPFPMNTSNGVRPCPTLNITVTDLDLAQTLTVCFWENFTTGGATWQKIQQNTSIGSSPVVFRVMRAGFANTKDTTYWWRVTACDGFSNVSIVSCFTVGDVMPFTLPNDPVFESSVKVHNGHSYSDQVVHADLLYFPNGWGDVNGSRYEYWLAVQGYVDSDDDTEQPCILVSHNISDNSWVEPAGNYYLTNPVSGFCYTDGNGKGHYDDGEVMYNDATDEIWYYINNHTAAGGNHYEIYTSSDGVNWSLNSYFLPFGNDFASISVIKEGSVWKCWGRNGSMSPAVFEYHTSPDGIHWTTVYNCGYEMAAPGMEIWHSSVNRYNGQYWCLLIEDPVSLGGEDARMFFINSTDGMNWTSYPLRVLDVSYGWDSTIIYRGDFIVQDGVLKGIYTGKGDSEWHAGYTFNLNVGGTGNSSNIVPDSK